MQETKLLPPSYFFLALVSSILIHTVLPHPRLIAYPWNLTGLLPIALGAVLNLIADRAFNKAETTVKPAEAPRVLLVKGVFSLSRNPMYLGMVLILLGTNLIMGTLPPIVITIGFFIFMDRQFIREEELKHEKQFDDEWRKYRSRVRRWI